MGTVRNQDKGSTISNFMLTKWVHFICWYRLALSPVLDVCLVSKSSNQFLNIPPPWIWMEYYEVWCDEKSFLHSIPAKRICTSSTLYIPILIPSYPNCSIQAAYQTWHKGCFTCNTCNKGLDTSTVCDNANKLYCRPCYGRNFGPKGNDKIMNREILKKK